MTNKITRHIGRIKSTDKRCVVVMMQLQDEKGNILDPNNAMVVDVDSLPDRLQQPLVYITMSAEGQNETILARLLSRQAGPDGFDLFTSLCGSYNGANFVRKIPVDDVIMYPNPINPVPLRQVLEAIGSPPTSKTTVEETTKFNPFDHNLQVDQTETRIATAKRLLQEAKDFELIAIKKQREAWQIAPELKPLQPGEALNKIEKSDGEISANSENMVFDENITIVSTENINTSSV